MFYRIQTMCYESAIYLKALGIPLVGNLAGSRSAAGRTSPSRATALCIQSSTSRVWRTTAAAAASRSERDAISRSAEHGVAPDKWLRAGTDRVDTLRVRVSLRRDEVLEEVVEITAVVGLLRGGNEAEDRHLGVHALVQLPRDAADGDSGDR